MTEKKKKGKPNLQLDHDFVKNRKLRAAMKVHGAQSGLWYLGLACGIRMSEELRLDTSVPFFWEAWAEDLFSEVKELKAFVEDAVSRFFLLVMQEERFLSCNRVVEDVTAYRERLKAQSIGGRKGWEISKGLRDPEPGLPSGLPEPETNPTRGVTSGSISGPCRSSSDFDPQFWDRSNLTPHDLGIVFKDDRRARADLVRLEREYTAAAFKHCVGDYFRKWKMLPPESRPKRDRFILKLETWLHEDRHGKLNYWKPKGGGQWSSRETRQREEDVQEGLKRIGDIISKTKKVGP